MWGRRGVFADSFRCHSVSLLAAEQQRDGNRLEYSDKIILPPSTLEKLAHLEVTYPMMFELTNPRYVQRRLHCGVLEYIAQEGMVYLPYWMMENMHLNEGDIVHLKSASISKGRYVKLQPQTTDFIKISNPKAVLESSLRNFSALTKGETFRILYNKKVHVLPVLWLLVLRLRLGTRKRASARPGEARARLHELRATTACAARRRQGMLEARALRVAAACVCDIGKPSERLPWLPDAPCDPRIPPAMEHRSTT